MESEIEARLELQRYGLSDQEALLYLALLKGNSTASEVAEHTGIPRTRIYEVARELESKGFLEMNVERPLKLRAIEPSTVLRRLKAGYEEKIQDLEQNSPQIISILESIPSKEEEGESIWSINGESNVISKFNEMCGHAENEICFTTSRFSAIEKIEKTLLEQKAHNVEIRAAVPVLECTKPYAKRLAQFCNLRHFDHRIRFLLVDRAEVLIFLVDPVEGIKDFMRGDLPSCETALYSRNSCLVYIFSQFFDEIWEGSVVAEEMLE
jgi:sugar-specific transcriptional regulator TrmB